MANRMDMTLSAIAGAYRKARIKHAPMRGPHEGYAIILEEFDELWDEIKKWQPKPIDEFGPNGIAYRENMTAMRKETLHVAAMALAFLIEVCRDE